MITRHLINKNIKFHDVAFTANNEPSVKSYTYDDLCLLIDRYKNLLIANGAELNCSAVIGTPVCITQTALFFACSELGISVSIVDHIKPLWSNKKYRPLPVSTKVQILLPINYLLSKGKRYTNNNQKTKALMQVAIKTLIVDDHINDDSHNPKISAQNDTVILRCTTSGTTGTPKVLEHTHDFLEKLIKRNSSMFDGKIGLIANLNHGSSPATFFLPSIVSEKVTDIYHIISPAIGGTKLVNTNDNHAVALSVLKEHGITINHLMFPYTESLEIFLKSNQDFKDCTLYTLGVIKSEWIEKVKNRSIKDIISIFGTNETSGSIFINQASDLDFHENTYEKLDDFYGININEKNDLEVTIPVYNKTVITGDMFTKKGGKFLHLGRSNLYRINDLEINLNSYIDVLKNHCNGDIILDENKNSIYMVIWDETIDLSVVQTIDRMMRMDSQNLHYISKYDCLKKESFMTGIKVDKQLLREYFRNMVNQKTLY